jgi:alkanesulfonate monooxygenase SsuD/methylene tetrahydromethanopterin reductase-like flavin-dependent oxidoreductase (luciferase family)
MLEQVMKFGIFDHLEQRRGVALADLYEERLKLIEQAERAGIDCWLTAEHHHSPLCMAPNQMVFFAAAAARTSTIKLGSLVSVLPLHHPVRLLEELCMMDHLSKGRLQIGVGKGPTGSEFAMWGGDPDARQAVFDEAMIILLQGMQSEFLDFKGKHFSFSNLWMAVRPYQTPHPPFWYGENAATAGKLRANVVFHGSNKGLNEKIRIYKAALAASKPDWRSGICHNDAPIYGATRRVYLAPTLEEARERARTGYAVYLGNFRKPATDDYVEGDIRTPRVPPPKFGPTAISFEQGLAGESLIAGTPSMLRDHLRDYMRTTDANYYGLSFQWGDLNHQEASRSMQLFADEVMPLAREMESRRATLPA